MQSLGTKLRQQRHRLGLTLDELADLTSISKPYLSLIETGRVPNPPSDEKLRRLEETLEFTAGELISYAELHRTPVAVRAVLNQLLHESDDVPADDNKTLARLARQLEQAAGQSTAGLAGNIPIVNAVSSGYPRDFADLEYPRAVAGDFVACPGVADEQAFGLRVFGDRMLPSYADGDIVIFSPAAAVRSGDDCCIRFDTGQTQFLRVFFETGDDGQPILRLQPRNEKHRPQMVAADKIAATYKAVYRLHAVNETTNMD